MYAVLRVVPLEQSARSPKMSRRWVTGVNPVAIFVRIPSAALIYAIAGLVIFAGLTAFDFQPLRRARTSGPRRFWLSPIGRPCRST